MSLLVHCIYAFTFCIVRTVQEEEGALDGFDSLVAVGLVDAFDQALKEEAFLQREDRPFVSFEEEEAFLQMEDLALAVADHGLE